MNKLKSNEFGFTRARLWRKDMSSVCILSVSMSHGTADVLSRLRRCGLRFVCILSISMPYGTARVWTRLRL